MLLIHPRAFKAIAMVFIASFIFITVGSAMAELEKMTEEEASEVHAQGGISAEVAENPEEVDSNEIRMTLRLANKLSQSIPDDHSLNAEQQQNVQRAQQKIKAAQNMMKFASNLESLLVKLQEAGMGEGVRMGLAMLSQGLGNQ